MKALWRSLLLTLTLTALLVVGAAAAHYTAAAEELAQIGIFRGTNAGFELDRAPTRTEAAAMLVRLLGAETQAAEQFASGEIAHPFTDVAPWADHYVAWLYSNGLTRGMNEKQLLFGGGSADLCTAQMYATFLLRTLGYDDRTAGDFTYAQSVDFAKGLGLAEDSILTGVFLRDHLAAMTLQALATDSKDSGRCLLETLVADGAIAKTDAQRLLQTIGTYRSWAKANAALADKTAVDMTMKTEMDVLSPAGTLLTMTTRIDMKTQPQPDGTLAGAYRISMDTALGFTMDIEGWEKDGWSYLRMGEQATKSVADPAQSRLIPMDWSVDPLYLLRNINRTKDSSGTVYQLVLSSVAEGLVNEVASEGALVSDIYMEVLFSPGGTLQSIHMLFDQTDATGLNSNVLAVCTYNAFGEDVTILWPDFSAFTEVAVTA